MQSVKQLDQHIQLLIQANYNRMMAFEHAAHLTNDADIKAFYIARADESEANIKQLYICLNMSHQEAEQLTADQAAQPAGALLRIFTGKKTALKILEAVQTLEMTIAKWYKNAMGELKGMPRDLIELVDQQYQMINHAQLQLARL